MAPQKRTTKQAKPNPRQAKLDAFLEDFDAEGNVGLLFFVATFGRNVNVRSRSHVSARLSKYRKERGYLGL